MIEAMKKKERLPIIDLKELEEEMEINRRQRREFIDLYAEWIKNTPNKVWSKQHKRFLDG